MLMRMKSQCKEQKLNGFNFDLQMQSLWCMMKCLTSPVLQIAQCIVVESKMV